MDFCLLWLCLMRRQVDKLIFVQSVQGGISACQGLRGTTNSQLRAEETLPAAEITAVPVSVPAVRHAQLVAQVPHRSQSDDSDEIDVGE
eukprot:191494-Hanusia_phi.AAC.1